MSRIFTDNDLLTWEVYASGGKFGLPENPKIIFQCRSDPARRARYVRHSGDEADAQEAVAELPEGRLIAMLHESRELD